MYTSLPVRDATRALCHYQGTGLSVHDVVQAMQDPFTSGEGPSSTDTQAAALAANGWYHPSGQSSPRLQLPVHHGGSQPPAPGGEHPEHSSEALARPVTVLHALLGASNLT